jgi:hypothetical protein
MLHFAYIHLRLVIICNCLERSLVKMQTKNERDKRHMALFNRTLLSGDSYVFWFSISAVSERHRLTRAAAHLIKAFLLSIKKRTPRSETKF